MTDLRRTAEQELQRLRKNPEGAGVLIQEALYQLEYAEHRFSVLADERDRYRKVIERAYRELSNCGREHDAQHNARWRNEAMETLRTAQPSQSSEPRSNDAPDDRLHGRG